MEAMLPLSTDYQMLMLEMRLKDGKNRSRFLLIEIGRFLLAQCAHRWKASIARILDAAIMQICLALDLPRPVMYIQTHDSGTSPSLCPCVIAHDQLCGRRTPPKATPRLPSTHARYYSVASANSLEDPYHDQFFIPVSTSSERSRPGPDVDGTSSSHSHPRGDSKSKIAGDVTPTSVENVCLELYTSFRPFSKGQQRQNETLAFLPQPSAIGTPLSPPQSVQQQQQQQQQQEASGEAEPTDHPCERSNTSEEERTGAAARLSIDIDTWLDRYQCGYGPITDGLTVSHLISAMELFAYDRSEFIVDSYFSSYQYSHIAKAYSLYLEVNHLVTKKSSGDMITDLFTKIQTFIIQYNIFLRARAGLPYNDVTALTSPPVTQPFTHPIVLYALYSLPRDLLYLAQYHDISTTELPPALLEFVDKHHTGHQQQYDTRRWLHHQISNHMQQQNHQQQQQHALGPSTGQRIPHQMVYCLCGDRVVWRLGQLMTSLAHLLIAFENQNLEYVEQGYIRRLKAKMRYLKQQQALQQQRQQQHGSGSSARFDEFGLPMHHHNNHHDDIITIEPLHVPSSSTPRASAPSPAQRSHAAEQRQQQGERDVASKPITSSHQRQLGRGEKERTRNRPAPPATGVTPSTDHSSGEYVDKIDSAVIISTHHDQGKQRESESTSAVDTKTSSSPLASLASVDSRYNLLPDPTGAANSGRRQDGRSAATGSSGGVMGTYSHRAIPPGSGVSVNPSPAGLLRLPSELPQQHRDDDDDYSTRSFSASSFPAPGGSTHALITVPSTPASVYNLGVPALASPLTIDGTTPRQSNANDTKELFANGHSRQPTRGKLGSSNPVILSGEILVQNGEHDNNTPSGNMVASAPASAAPIGQRPSDNSNRKHIGRLSNHLPSRSTHLRQDPASHAQDTPSSQHTRFDPPQSDPLRSKGNRGTGLVVFPPQSMKSGILSTSSIGGGGKSLRDKSIPQGRARTKGHDIIGATSSSGRVAATPAPAAAQSSANQASGGVTLHPKEMIYGTYDIFSDTTEAPALANTASYHAHRLYSSLQDITFYVDPFFTHSQFSSFSLASTDSPLPPAPFGGPDDTMAEDTSSLFNPREMTTNQNDSRTTDPQTNGRSDENKTSSSLSSSSHPPRLYLHPCCSARFRDWSLSLNMAADYLSHGVQRYVSYSPCNLSSSTLPLALEASHMLLAATAVAQLGLMLHVPQRPPEHLSLPASTLHAVLESPPAVLTKPAMLQWGGGNGHACPWSNTIMSHCLLTHLSAPRIFAVASYYRWNDALFYQYHHKHNPGTLSSRKLAHTLQITAVAMCNTIDMHSQPPHPPSQSKIPTQHHHCAPVSSQPLFASIADQLLHVISSPIHGLLLLRSVCPSASLASILNRKSQHWNAHMRVRAVIDVAHACFYRHYDTVLNLLVSLVVSLDVWIFQMAVQWLHQTIHNFQMIISDITEKIRMLNRLLDEFHVHELTRDTMQQLSPTQLEALLALFQPDMSPKSEGVSSLSSIGLSYGLPDYTGDIYRYILSLSASVSDDSSHHPKQLEKPSLLPGDTTLPPTSSSSPDCHSLLIAPIESVCPAEDGHPKVSIQTYLESLSSRLTLIVKHARHQLMSSYTVATNQQTDFEVWIQDCFQAFPSETQSLLLKFHYEHQSYLQGQLKRTTTEAHRQALQQIIREWDVATVFREHWEVCCNALYFASSQRMRPITAFISPSSSNNVVLPHRLRTVTHQWRLSLKKCNDALLASEFRAHLIHEDPHLRFDKWELIGTGSFGNVYKAIDTQVDHPFYTTAANTSTSYGSHPPTTTHHKGTTPPPQYTTPHDSIQVNGGGKVNGVSTTTLDSSGLAGSQFQQPLGLEHSNTTQGAQPASMLHGDDDDDSDDIDGVFYNPFDQLPSSASNHLSDVSLCGAGDGAGGAAMNPNKQTPNPSIVGKDAQHPTTTTLTCDVSPLSSQQASPTLPSGSSGGGVVSSILSAFASTASWLMDGLDNTKGTSPHAQHITPMVAIKQMSIATEQGAMAGIRETNTMRHCAHPNIVRLRHTYLYEQSLWLVMDLREGGTLADLSRTTPLSEPCIAYIIREVLLGLAFLHSKNRIHRDLKPANILLHLDGVVQIADLGLCIEYDEYTLTTSLAGTENYISPEMVSNEGYTRATDIWSLGCCLVEMCNRKAPHKHISTFSVLYRTAMGDPPELLEFDEDGNQVRTTRPLPFQHPPLNQTTVGYDYGLSPLGSSTDGTTPTASMDTAAQQQYPTPTPPVSSISAATPTHNLHRAYTYPDLAEHPTDDIKFSSSPTPPSNYWSPELCDFLAKCLTKNPLHRPTAEDLLLHPFLNGSNVASRQELEDLFVSALLSDTLRSAGLL